VGRAGVELPSDCSPSQGFSPETERLWRVKDSTLEPPASARIVGNEPGPVEVGVVRVLRGDTTCGNEDAGLEHASHHGAHAELARSLDHAQRGREAAALDQLHVDPVEVQGKPIDILFERAAFIGDDRNRIRTADHLAIVRIR